MNEIVSFCALPRLIGCFRCALCAGNWCNCSNIDQVFFRYTFTCTQLAARKYLFSIMPLSAFLALLMHRHESPHLSAFDLFHQLNVFPRNNKRIFHWMKIASTLERSIGFMNEEGNEIGYQSFYDVFFSPDADSKSRAIEKNRFNHYWFHFSKDFIPNVCLGDVCDVFIQMITEIFCFICGVDF